MKWLEIEPKRATEVPKDYQDPLELMEDLVKSFYGGKAKRNKMDRYRDFRSIFYGSEAGKRVLYEILGLAGLYRPETPEVGDIDVYRVFEKIGRKKMGLDLLTILSNEPKPERDGVVHNRKGK